MEKHPFTQWHPAGYPTFLYAKSSKGSSWTKGKLSWISLHSCRKAAWHRDFRPSLSFSCHEVSSHFSLAWSRQNSRVPLNRTTSGVPVSSAFFFPWSRYVSDHQFCAASQLNRPFFPSRTRRTWGKICRRFAFSSRAADHMLPSDRSRDQATGPLPPAKPKMPK